MDFKLDSDGDLEVVDGEVSLVSDQDAIVQNLNIRLRTFLGEWFLDTNVGMPYFEEFLVKKPNRLIIETRIREAVLETPGVVSLTSLEYDLNTTTRNLSITLTAKMRSGEHLTLTFNDLILGD